MKCIWAKGMSKSAFEPLCEVYFGKVLLQGQFLSLLGGPLVGVLQNLRVFLQKLLEFQLPEDQVLKVLVLKHFLHLGFSGVGKRG